MFTEEDVIAKIKSKHAGSVALYYLTLLIMPGIFILMIISIFGIGDLTGIALVFFMGAIASIITDLLIYKKIVKPAIKEQKDITTDPVFRVFKTPAELVAALNEAKQAETIYEFNSIKVTDKCIVDFNDPRTVMIFGDIIGLSISTDPHNSDGVALFVSDNHNRTCHYSMSGDREAAKHVANLLAERCPQIKNRTLEQSSVVTEL